MPVEDASSLTELLQKHFGFATFHPYQEEIVRAVLEGKDCLVLLPTGGGKSLCFQLPSLILDGITLVVSPLISLMKDQVDGLRANGIEAALLNSTLSPEEMLRTEQALRAGTIKMLYVSPERLAIPAFRQMLAELPVRLLAVDEAHCISEWGHDFRTDYRLLATVRADFPDIPCIALTATATERVREDIAKQLRLHEHRTFLGSFDRPNLRYRIEPKRQAFDRLVSLLKQYGKQSVIVYCFSRKDTENVAFDLQAEGIQALPYHAGLPLDVRQRTQEQFIQDEISIIVATIAFGMGIDKPDVRAVVHMDIPRNLEEYYQETGRAGRDGLPSDCVLFYTRGDTAKHRFFINQMADDEQRDEAENKLLQIVRFCEEGACRRRHLLRYFGETYAAPTCAACDVCLEHREEVDATEIAQKILCAVIRTNERFGAAHVTQVLRGRSTARIRQWRHETLSVFGTAREWSDEQLRDLISMVLERGLLGQAPGQYPTLYVTTEGKIFLTERRTLILRKPREAATVSAPNLVEQECEQELFERLRVLRRQIAIRQNVASFVVFPDKSLLDMAFYLPQSDEQFRRISGVSDRKLQTYGEAFIGVIRTYAAEHHLAERIVPLQVASTKRRSQRAAQRPGSTYDETAQLLRQKLPLPRIAAIRGLAPSTILSHIERLREAGTVIDISPLRPPSEEYQEIAAAFKSADTNNLTPVFERLKGKYSFDQIRLVRLFLQEEALVAN